MCTMGMVKRYGHESEPKLFVAKTVDTQPTKMVHERLHNNGVTSILSFRMGWQPGINAGMNEQGLVVMSSYLGWKKPSRMSQMPNFQQDTRGLANMFVLQKHTTVEPAAKELVRYFGDNPSSVGGVHFLMDAEGRMAVVEHAEGQIGFEFIENSEQSNFSAAVRANHAQLIEPIGREGETIEAEDAADRTGRCGRMLAGLSSLAEGDWLHDLKNLLGSHLNPECRQHGQICIHDFWNDGQRSVSHTAHSTETALIFDVSRRTMIYSEGSPCRHQWKSITF